MAAVECPPQLEELAEIVNGDVTEAPFEGLPTPTSSEVATAGAAPETLIATSVTQDAPPCPHDLTCRVWAPVDAETLVLIELLLMIVLALLLSNE
jgi:hypothetical protein